MATICLILLFSGSCSAGDADGSELDEAEEVLGILLPADDETTLPVKPRLEALGQPAALVAAQDAPILCLEHLPVLPVRRDHLNAFYL